MGGFHQRGTRLPQGRLGMGGAFPVGTIVGRAMNNMRQKRHGLQEGPSQRRVSPHPAGLSNILLDFHVGWSLFPIT